MTQVLEKLNWNELLKERIFIFSTCADKCEVLNQLVHSVCLGTELDENFVAAQIRKREEGLGTTLDTGLNIPHARLDELENFRAALAVLPEGFSGPAAKPKVKAVFLFLSPARSAFFQKHLQLLAALAETFTPDFMDRLAHCSCAEDVSRALSAKTK